MDTIIYFIWQVFIFHILLSLYTVLLKVLPVGVKPHQWMNWFDLIKINNIDLTRNFLSFCIQTSRIAVYERMWNFMSSAEPSVFVKTTGTVKLTPLIHDQYKNEPKINVTVFCKSMRKSSSLLYVSLSVLTNVTQWMDVLIFMFSQMKV